MSVPVPAKYIADFEQLGFGMFVHWGLYSQLGKGEWYFTLGYPGTMEEYSQLTKTFTAADFDAEYLAQLAQKAGCRYITLTTRHQEGFSLYDTCGLSDFDAPHAIGRDLVREFVDGCRKYDIVPFFFHTTLDWHHPDFENDFDAYLEYLRKSVEVLCTNYGKIGGLWFDGNWSKPDADWKTDALYATIRKHQPEAMIINNTGLSHRGVIGSGEIDAVTFEQGRPTPMDREGMPKYVAAEMCGTMNDHWGHATMDFNFTAPKVLIENLCCCRRAGANYLLNIGPMEHGAVNPMQEQIMTVIGRWMKLYGEAIYDGRPYPASCGEKRFILKGKNALYLFFFDHAQNGNENVTLEGEYCGEITFRNVCDKISEIHWMDNGEVLSFTQEEDALTVNATGYPYGMSTCVRVAKASI